jgi:hypothetical protein
MYSPLPYLKNGAPVRVAVLIVDWFQILCDQTLVKIYVNIVVESLNATK